MPPGLLLLHGFTGSPSSWNLALAGLDRSVRVLAPALVGHGDATTAEVAGFDAEVDRIAALAAGPTKWHLAGYSLGGRIAVGLLCAHPELFVGATLIGAQPGLESDSERADRRAADERWCAMLREQGMTEFVAAWESQPLFASQRGLPSGVLERQRAERLAALPEGFIRSLRATGLGVMPSYWGDLGEIGVPVTLAVGSSDEKFTKIAEKMAARIPDARLEVVQGSGHNVLIERPEAIGALLATALREGSRE